MRDTREYRWPPSHAFLIKPTDDMNDILFNQVKMDTQTVYQVNGDMFITPASYEQHKAPIMEKRLCYKGSVHLDEDGKAHVKRYNIGSQGTRYITLCETEHCVIKRARKTGLIVETWQFNPTMTLSDIQEVKERERPRIEAYYKSRKEVTQW